MAIIISEDTTWGLDGSPYQFSESVHVEPGNRLTILPGVVVQFTSNDETNPGYSPILLVKNGAALFAEGTVENPVTFTSALEDPFVDTTDHRTYRNQWGGIIICGPATTGRSELWDGNGAPDIPYALPSYNGFANTVFGFNQDYQGYAVIEGTPTNQSYNGQDWIACILTYVRILHGGALLGGEGGMPNLRLPASLVIRLFKMLKCSMAVMKEFVLLVVMYAYERL